MANSFGGLNPKNKNYFGSANSKVKSFKKTKSLIVDGKAGPKQLLRLAASIWLNNSNPIGGLSFGGVFLFAVCSAVEAVPYFLFPGFLSARLAAKSGCSL